MRPDNSILFSFLDLTSLNPQDSVSSIRTFAKASVSHIKSGFKPAAICVYPNYAGLVKEIAAPVGVKTAVVGATFPASQSFEAVKMMECSMAVKAGAEEVDIVLNLGAFFEKNYRQVVQEIELIKDVIGTANLKVILETGLLETAENITKAAELAIEGGADFLKTSTGKVAIGATPEAVKIMAHVAQANKRNGVSVGIKVSGGVRAPDDARLYYDIVAQEFGEELMTKEYFRIGASGLASALINE